MSDRHGAPGTSPPAPGVSTPAPGAFTAAEHGPLPAGCTAVIVPYYQRQGGLLARALRSALTQQAAAQVHAVVVDDGSPFPAARELADLEPGLARRVHLRVRVNGGPGAARNTALELAADTAATIAFLDSDDTWRPGHLARAERAFAVGAEVYLSNWMPLESSVDAYTHFKKLDLSEHAALEDDLWRYRGNFFLQELTRPIGRLSTMVVRSKTIADLRFEERLRCAFEDRLFRLEMALRNPAIVFSTRPEVDCGEGVNVFSSRQWGTVGRMEIARDELFAARLIRRRMPLGPEQNEALRAIEARERRDGWASFLRVVARQRRLPLRAAARLFAADPTGPLRAWR